MKDLFIKISVAASLILTLIFNALATGTGLNNIQTAEISEKYSNLFLPAGYVFSIWGVIYTLLIIFTYIQFRKKEISNSVRVAFIGINLLNALWLTMWHYDQLILSVGVMIAILLLLIYIYQKISELKLKTFQEKITIKHPFSIYLGWISVATIANISVTLTKYNFDGFSISFEIWATLLIAVATSLGLFALLQREDAVYTSVLIWAFVGIFVKFSSTNSGLVALICAGLLLTLITLKKFKFL